MDEFERFLLEMIGDAEHFLQNAGGQLDCFKAAWEVHREELQKILKKYQSLRGIDKHRETLGK